MRILLSAVSKALALLAIASFLCALFLICFRVIPLAEPPASLFLTILGCGVLSVLSAVAWSPVSDAHWRMTHSVRSVFLKYEFEQPWSYLWNCKVPSEATLGKYIPVGCRSGNAAEADLNITFNWSTYEGGKYVRRGGSPLLPECGRQLRCTVEVV